MVLADSWSKFRPISLCSCFHKIISKILNDRLTPLLPSLISENQSGFLPGRSIVDNILLTQELASSIDHKIRGSNLILKLNLLKAYDRVNWGLTQIISALDFSENRVDLIMKYVSGCHISILVNGESYGFIPSAHGLRQGDPSLPSLFILAGEYFSRGLNSLFTKNPSLFYHSKGKLQISHLAYVDDYIIFYKGFKTGLQKLMAFFKHYELVSRQKINVSKNNIFLGKRANGTMTSETISF